MGGTYAGTEFATLAGNPAAIPSVAKGRKFRLRTLAIVIASISTMLLGLWATAGPVASANATSQNFCSYAYLAPYGKSGDRCYSGWRDGGFGAYLWSVHSGEIHSTSVCVNAIEWEGLITNWRCNIAGYDASLNLPNNSRWLHGAVRNNNMSSSTYVLPWVWY
jgi:hypothetical protein